MSDNEKVYFEEGGVSVTKTRFIVPGQTYAMSGITSVKSVVNQPLKGPIILGGLGLIAMLSFEAETIVIGLLLLVAAILWFVKGRKHTVILSSASGEVEALSSSNSDFIGKIIAALNDAIVERG